MPTALKVVLRFLWYLFSRLLIWAIAIAFIILSFFVAMDYMNVQILTKDGMKVRAEVIIKGDDPTALSKVFSKGFLEHDDMLESDAYRQYIVSDFDYSADMNFILIFPWNDTVTVRVTEEVSNIDAEVYANAENAAQISETPPEWDNAVYDVTLVAYEDNWRIVSMELVEYLPKPSPSPTIPPTPSPTQTPAPSPTQTPETTQQDTTPPSEIIED